MLQCIHSLTFLTKAPLSYYQCKAIKMTPFVASTASTLSTLPGIHDALAILVMNIHSFYQQ